jgi:hypothetical protein
LLGPTVGAASCRSCAADDSLDKLIDPRHGGINIGKHVDVLDRRLIESSPAVVHGNGRRPRLLTSVVEESLAYGPDLGQVEILAPVEELQVDEIAHPFAARLREGMELLRDLMISTHDPDWLRRFEPELCEQLSEVVRELVLRLVGVADLVVAELELHRAPRPAAVVELHVEGLHDVRSRNAGRSRRCLLYESAGEPCPASG